MNRRVFLAGLVAGIAMYAWDSVAHTALPLGQAGIGEITNETALLTTMHDAVSDKPGLYLFPSMGSISMADYGKKLASNPSGMLIYNPAGASPLSPGQLAGEFALEVVLCILLSWLLAQTSLVGFGARFGFVAVAGLLASLWTNLSYWIWYSFPSTYTVAYLSTQFVGFLCAGLVIVAMTKPKTAVGA